MVKRTPEQVREHYEVEKELAARLKRASRDERQRLYAKVYDELFRRLPHHPQLTQKATAAESEAVVRNQMRILAPLLRADTRYLEVGIGDGALALAVAGKVSQVVAVDVSAEITKGIACPPNFKLTLTDGTRIPVPPGTIDIAFSSDLIEHLHPEDAVEQTRGVFAALCPGGKYLCVTPNRLGGPWDVSSGFSRVSEGFHLKEYSIAELTALFRGVGFGRIRVLMGWRGRLLHIPAALAIFGESLLGRLPRAWRKAVSRRVVSLGYIRMVAEKSSA